MKNLNLVGQSLDVLVKKQINTLFMDDYDEFLHQDKSILNLDLSNTKRDPISKGVIFYNLKLKKFDSSFA